MGSYLCIDLKSFYASVECVERGLDPMTALLVVADPTRSSGTLCLAVSPALKALGVKNRCRVYEIPPHIDYITAPPRMKLYIDYSAKIYGVYLKYISPEDIHVYSIDEVFIDISPYLKRMDMTAVQAARFLMEKVAEDTGIPSASGVGTNLYLAKIALDITAKHSPDRIGVLDEDTYRAALWEHRPLTDFWRVGKGTAARLEKMGIYTMRDIAYADENLLYKRFGIDAELLIDHAWGREPVTIADIKAYRPKSSCLSSGQVLMRDYDFEEGALIVREMTEALCLDMTEKGLLTSSVGVSVGYTKSAGLPSAKAAAALDRRTNLCRVLIPEADRLYRSAVRPDIPVRRICISFNNIVPDDGIRQSGFFDDGKDERGENLQRAINEIKKKYGKNSMLKGMDLQQAATARERNMQIGGHKSGEQS